MDAIAVIDQGTSSARVSLFDMDGNRLSFAQRVLQARCTDAGWVEMFPEDIWASTLSTWRQALIQANLSPADVVALGITNQRETTIVWNQRTGQPIYNAIVWQDRRTQSMCDVLSKQIDLSALYQKTGLMLDPYFSASKIAWLLEHVSGARELAESGELLFGTVDTFLLWRLTNGMVHATDVTNASRTLLYNIHRHEWDEALLSLFNIPASMLPEVRDCADDFGCVQEPAWRASTPIRAIAGDQQAALIGQSCLAAGMAKMTIGTGGFLVVNTGNQVLSGDHGLLQTIAYRVDGICHYATEGSIYSAGSTINWLRDDMQLISTATDSEVYAKSVSDNGGVYLIPAFVGLAAPQWRSDVRAAWVGMSFSTRPAHLVRAALEAVAYQTRDLVDCLNGSGAEQLDLLRVDGGMSQNGWLMQFLSDQLQLPVLRSAASELTTEGIVVLLRHQLGLSSLWCFSKVDDPDESFLPQESKDDLYRSWRDALNMVLHD